MDERTLEDIRRALIRREPSLERMRLHLRSVANRPGVAPALVRIVAEGGFVESRLAALALREAESEFVRRGVERELRSGRAERTAHWCVAARPAEKHPELDAKGVFLEALDPLLLNDPALFVAWAAEDRVELGLTLVERIEAMRARYGVGPASLYAHVLARRPSGQARALVLELLGRTPGAAAQALLEREERREALSAASVAIRRERMRQTTRAPVSSTGQVTARLRFALPGADETIEWIEALSGGISLGTVVTIAPEKALEWWCEPHFNASAPPVGAAISLGQVRSMVEAIPARLRLNAAALEERLSCVEAAPLPRPAPTSPLSRSSAAALLDEPDWLHWRPLVAMEGWSEVQLAEGRELPREAWPPHVETAAELAPLRLTAYLASEAAAEALARRLRIGAIHLHLRGDSRSEGMAADAVAVARGKPTALAIELAARELARRLPTEAELPDAYRQELRDALRTMIGATEPTWVDVQTLDLAQAELESAARASVQPPSWSALPDVATLACADALEAAKALLSQVGARTSGDQPLRAWPAFVERVCLRECPVRCFSRKPVVAPSAVWDGPCPGSSAVPPVRVRRGRR